jgi:hypothetical protein
VQGTVGCNHEERAEGWVEDVWMEVIVEAEAKGGVAADQSHGQYRVGCGAELSFLVMKDSPAYVSC